MNLMSVKFSNSGSSISSIFNQKGNSSLFKLGNTFSAKVLDKKNNNFLLEAFENTRFETSFSSINPNIGDTLDFEVVSSGDNSLALKLVNAITPTSTRGGVSQLSNHDLMELFKQSNFVKDEDINSVDDSYGTNSQQEENLKISKVISKIQNQLSYASNNLSLAAVNELLSSGICMSKIDVELLNSMLKEIEESPNFDINNNNISKDNEQQKDEIIKVLTNKKLPVTEKNIENIEKAIKTYNDVSKLDDSTIIHILKQEKDLTLDNIYLSKYSAGNNTVYTENINVDSWQNLKSEIDKLFVSEDIPTTKENMDIAKLLVSNELPITKDNVDIVLFLRNINENIDMPSFINQAVNNIRKDIPITEIDLNKSVYSQDRENLNNTYKNILKDLPNISPEIISTLEALNKPITLFNLRNSQYNNSTNEQLPKTSDTNIAYRRELAEIQLKLTSEAAFRLVGKNIDIDTMPLVKVVEELRILEKETYGKTLTLMGAEPSIENVERVQNLYDKIDSFKPLTTNVFSDIIKQQTPFTIDGISKSQLAAKAMEGYEAFLTMPNEKYGDSFNNVYGQLSSLVESLGIDPTQDDIRAASILSRNKMDVTFENIMQVKVIDQKINYVQNTLHPYIAANIIKDGLNPLKMHVDELISYIDSFNNEYGTDLKDKIAEHISDMDQTENLSKEDRASMIAIYRMLNEIQRNHGASLGLNIKSGQSPTLGHLLDASNYYTRTHGNFNYTDINIDNNFGTIENYNTPENNIRNLLNSTLQFPTEANISRINALLENNENVSPSMVNELTYNEMVLHSATDKLSTDVLKQLMETNNNLLNEPLPDLLQKLETLDIHNNIDNSKAIFEDIKNIVDFNPKIIQFLESNNIPPTIMNIQSMTHLYKKPGYLGDIINNLSNQEKRISFLDTIPKSPVEYVGDDETIKNTLNDISDNLDNLIFEDADSSLVKEIKLAQNAIKVQNYISQRQETFSLPIRLHDKVTNLNIFVPNGVIPTTGNVNVAISITTPKFGDISSYIKVNGENIELYLNTEDDTTLQLLKETQSNLSNIFNDIGYNIDTIFYNEELNNTNDPYNALPKNIISKTTKKQMFDIATSLTKYLDNL